MNLLSRRSNTRTGLSRQEHEVAVFLAEAQRLLDYHWRRADSFERKALGFLSFTGVIVALLTPSLKAVLDLHRIYRPVALSLGTCVIMLLAGSAACSAGALWARNSASVSVKRVRELWKEYLGRIEHRDGYSDAWHTNDLQRQLVEMLLHGREETTSPVQSLRVGISPMIMRWPSACSSAFRER
jgi:hypothetical protein